MRSKESEFTQSEIPEQAESELQEGQIVEQGESHVKETGLDGEKDIRKISEGSVENIEGSASEIKSGDYTDDRNERDSELKEDGI